MFIQLNNWHWEMTEVYCPAVLIKKSSGQDAGVPVLISNCSRACRTAVYYRFKYENNFQKKKNVSVGNVYQNFNII